MAEADPQPGCSWWGTEADHRPGASRADAACQAGRPSWTGRPQSGRWPMESGQAWAGAQVSQAWREGQPIVRSISRQSRPESTTGPRVVSIEDNQLSITAQGRVRSEYCYGSGVGQWVSCVEVKRETHQGWVSEVSEGVECRGELGPRLGVMGRVEDSVRSCSEGVRWGDDGRGDEWMMKTDHTRCPQGWCSGRPAGRTERTASGASTREGGTPDYPKLVPVPDEMN